MSKVKPLAALLLVLLVSCDLAPIQVPSFFASPTPTATPEPTKTSTPGPTATMLPSPTATPKSYPLCSVEDYEDCPVPVEDLYDGDYLSWLKTLSEPFDASVTNTPLEQGAPVLAFTLAQRKEFKQNPSSNPFRKGPVGSLITEEGYEGILLNWEGHSDLMPDENQWLITVLIRDSRVSEALWQEFLDLWVSSDTPAIHDYSGVELGKLIPLWREAYDRYPGMRSRTHNFRRTGDPAYLSGPGIVLPATVFK